MANRDTRIGICIVQHRLGKVGHRKTRGTDVSFELFKELKTLNFKISVVI